MQAHSHFNHVASYTLFFNVPLQMKLVTVVLTLLSSWFGILGIHAILFIIML